MIDLKFNLFEGNDMLNLCSNVCNKITNIGVNISGGLAAVAEQTIAFVSSDTAKDIVRLLPSAIASLPYAIAELGPQQGIAQVWHEVRMRVRDLPNDNLVEHTEHPRPS